MSKEIYKIAKEKGDMAKNKAQSSGGTVAYYLHESSVATYGVKPGAGGMITSILNGLPFAELSALQHGLSIPLEGLAKKLGISKATLHRRKNAGRLAPDESDRLVRFARLMGRAVEVLETKENAREWLLAPQVGLGNAVPLDYAETEVGAREVEDLLGRIEHGVYT